jgi:hypothetical protein
MHVIFIKKIKLKKKCGDNKKIKQKEKININN